MFYAMLYAELDAMLSKLDAMQTYACWPTLDANSTEKLDVETYGRCTQW